MELHKNFLKPVRTKKTKQSKSFSHDTITEVYERDGGACSVCRMRPPKVRLEVHPHHIFFRSELYSDIINWAENAATICVGCHAAVTNPTPQNKGREKDIKLKAMALERFLNNSGTSTRDLEYLEKIYVSKSFKPKTLEFDD